MADIQATLQQLLKAFPNQVLNLSIMPTGGDKVALSIGFIALCEGGEKSAVALPAFQGSYTSGTIDEELISDVNEIKASPLGNQQERLLEYARKISESETKVTADAKKAVAKAEPAKPAAAKKPATPAAVTTPAPTMFAPPEEDEPAATVASVVESVAVAAESKQQDEEPEDYDF